MVKNINNRKQSFVFNVEIIIVERLNLEITKVLLVLVFGGDN